MHKLFKLLPLVVTLAAGLVLVYADSLSLPDEKLENINELEETYFSYSRKNIMTILDHNLSNYNKCFLFQVRDLITCGWMT